MSRGNIKWATYPFIWGTSVDGALITAFNAAGYTYPFEDAAETFTIEAIATGYHFPRMNLAKHG